MGGSHSIINDCKFNTFKTPESQPTQNILAKQHCFWSQPTSQCPFHNSVEYNRSITILTFLWTLSCRGESSVESEVAQSPAQKLILPWLLVKHLTTWCSHSQSSTACNPWFSFYSDCSFETNVIYLLHMRMSYFSLYVKMKEKLIHTNQLYKGNYTQ